jgi:hypothetical protein
MRIKSWRGAGCAFLATAVTLMVSGLVATPAADLIEH